MKYMLKPDNSFEGGIPPIPFKIHPSVENRLDRKYMKFYDEVLADKAAILYSHRVPLAELKEGGNVIPGQSKPAEMAKIFEIDIERELTEGPKTIRARVFVPKGEAPTEGWPLFIWFHGGGWVLGGIDTENSYCTKAADLARCVVMTVDYRLAPEYPYPAAVDDAYESVIWSLSKGGDVLGINSKNIAIGGSSAGGNLTAIVTHKYAQSKFAGKFPPVKFQVLIVPVTDNTATEETNASWKENQFTTQLPAEKMMWYRYLYLPHPSDYSHPEASPLFYDDESFSKMPPCFIAAAECDVLRDEAKSYHDKLEKNGVESTLKIYKGVPHTCMVMDEVLQQGKDLISDSTSSLKHAFSS